MGSALGQVDVSVKSEAPQKKIGVLAFFPIAPKHMIILGTGNTRHVKVVQCGGNIRTWFFNAACYCASLMQGGVNELVIVELELEVTSSSKVENPLEVGQWRSAFTFELRM